jgi:hypothetical protein
MPMLPAVTSLKVEESKLYSIITEKSKDKELFSIMIDNFHPHSVKRREKIITESGLEVLHSLHTGHVQSLVTSMLGPFKAAP